MKPMRYLPACTGTVLLVAAGWSSSARAQGPSANVSVFATGLNNPRGSQIRAGRKPLCARRRNGRFDFQCRRM